MTLLKREEWHDITRRTDWDFSYVDDGTVYLEGRVATPRQKLAAVRATLGVPGVKGVRDRIVIDY